MDRINVFISHASEDDHMIGELQNKLKDKGLALANYSIDSSKPNNANNEDYIKGLLRPRVEKSKVVVVLLSANTVDRPWVDWEIEIANYFGRRIVGVWLPGEAQEGHEIPDPLKDFAHAVVGWQTDRIVDAITGKLNNHENSDGTTIPEVQIRRHDC